LDVQEKNKQYKQTHKNLHIQNVTVTNRLAYKKISEISMV
jgi:hypothetical protein